jgi:hypothetical protein
MQQIRHQREAKASFSASKATRGHQNPSYPHPKELNDAGQQAKELKPGKERSLEEEEEKKKAKEEKRGE